MCELRMATTNEDLYTVIAIPVVGRYYHAYLYHTYTKLVWETLKEQEGFSWNYYIDVTDLI